MDNTWPGKRNPGDFLLGENWYTDRSDPQLFDKNWQGGMTIGKWRSDILSDWAFSGENENHI